MRALNGRGLCALVLAASAAILAGTPGCSGRFEFDVPPQRGTGAGGSTAGSAGTVSGNHSGGGGHPPTTGGSDAANGGSQLGSAGLAGAGLDDSCGALPRCPAVLFCAEGECHECARDSDCTSPSLGRCDPDRHRCVACLTEQDCGAGFACDSLANRCLRKCGEGLDCPPDLHGCDEGRGVCYECDEDYECADAPTGQLCASDGSGCVQCRSDQDCQNQHCDPLSGRCVMCRDGRDCSTGLCDPGLHVCLTN